MTFTSRVHAVERESQPLLGGDQDEMTTTTTKDAKSAPALSDPFAAMREMRSAMLRSFFEPLALQRFDGESKPAINLKEQDGTYYLECALPGYKKDDVSVELTGDTVSISGSYKEEKRDEQAHYHRRELRQGSFARTIELPDEIDVDKAGATFENGMLRLTLPASKTNAKKKIPIGGG